MKRNKKNVAIILAAGLGIRFNGDGLLKQTIKLAGKPILLHTLEIFEKSTGIDEIIIVAKNEIIKESEKMVTEAGLSKVTKILCGGKSRQESSRIGILFCNEKNVNKILIHDATRPFVSQRIISDMIKNLDKFVSVDVAAHSSDTLIVVNDENIIVDIPKRSNFRRGQTPQGFRLSVIKKAHKLAMSEDYYEATDDCGLILHYGLGETYVVDGEDENIKITYPIDIDIADKLFQIKKVTNLKDFNLSKDLKNKKVLIFGHSSGIGKEIYNICKKFGCNVSGHSLSAGLDVCDFNKTNQVIEDFYKKNGKIDILISTVGILERKKLEDFSRLDILKQIDVNFTSQVNMVKSVIKKMAQSSSIMLFTSSSYTRGRETYSIYSATKAALVNFVQAISEEIIEKKIKINAMCPSRTKTPMRTRNFGQEPKGSLLSPRKVAQETLKACFSDFTGQIINIRR